MTAQLHQAYCAKNPIPNLLSSHITSRRDHQLLSLPVLIHLFSHSHTHPSRHRGFRQQLQSTTSPVTSPPETPRDLHIRDHRDLRSLRLDDIASLAPSQSKSTLATPLSASRLARLGSPSPDNSMSSSISSPHGETSLSDTMVLRRAVVICELKRLPDLAPSSIPSQVSSYCSTVGLLLRAVELLLRIGDRFSVSAFASKPSAILLVIYLRCLVSMSPLLVWIYGQTWFGQASGGVDLVDANKSDPFPEKTHSPSGVETAPPTREPNTLQESDPVSGRHCQGDAHRRSRPQGESGLLVKKSRHG